MLYFLWTNRSFFCEPGESVKSEQKKEEQKKNENKQKSKKKKKNAKQRNMRCTFHNASALGCYTFEMVFIKMEA